MTPSAPGALAVAPHADPRGQSSASASADEELDALHITYAATGDRQVRNCLAEAYDSFAVSIARQFPTRRESFEDLAQVARLGLLGAIERFDPTRGRPFWAYARSTINGALKRHLRDYTSGTS